MKELHLFVQEGCRPCMYAKTQLEKSGDGWENVVTITDAKKDGEWTDFAKECGVEATPTLVAIIDNNVVARMAGSNQMTRSFWQSVLYNHGAH